MSKENLKIISEEDLSKYRDQYMESDTRPATDEVRSTYNKMHDGFERYLDAVNDFEFKNGFMYALELVKRGVIEV